MFQTSRFFVNMRPISPVRPLYWAAVILTFNACIVRPAGATDLAQAYQQALVHDSVLASASAGHRAAIEVKRQARAGLGPVVQASLQTSYTNSQIGDFPMASGATNSGTLSVVQPLFQMASYLALESADHAVEKLDAQLAGAQQELILRVATAYLNVLLAQDTVALNQANSESIGKQLAQAKRSYEVGVVAVTDFTDAQARFDMQHAQVVQSRISQDLAKKALEALTGLETRGLATIPMDHPPEMAQPDDLQHWLEAAQSANLEVVQARALLAGQKVELRRSKWAYAPTLDLVASMNRNYYGSANLDITGQGSSQNSTAGLQLTIPIFDSGFKDSRVSQAVAFQEQAQADLDTAVRTATQNARQSFLSLQANIAQATAYEQAVASSRVSLDGAIKGKDVGTRTTTDVLSARDNYFQAQTSLLQARYNAVINLLQLKATVANLRPADLNEITTAAAREE